MMFPFCLDFRKAITSGEWRVKLKVLVAQLCPTLCNPMACNLPGSFVHGILQARILEWIASPFSRGSSKPRDRTQVSHIAGGFFTIWATKVMLKSFKLGSNSTWTKNFQMYKLDLEKAEEPEIKLPSSIGSEKKQGNSRKTSTSA